MDGSRILSWILPQKAKMVYNRLEDYGMFILMVLLFTVGFGGIFKVAAFVQGYLYMLLGVS